MEHSCRHAMLLLACLFFPGAASGEVFDHDGDGDVDLEDFGDFASCLAGPEVEAPGPCADTHDGDGDLDVDLADFGLFQIAFTGSPSGITATQLAGNLLGNYPFFEYVRAFNENATVNVAIDPTRFPDIVGQTCDIYVVDAKTQPQWTADPSLVDVTAGGARTETFGGSTIQDNTFLVAESGELSADAGIGLGAGYDVVLDCDQNGQLNSGDSIDGLSREAGLYVVHDTTQPGPLTVTVIEYSGGPWLGQRTFFPTDITFMGQLPLVVISHGWTHEHTYYDHIGYHLASYGYVVMSHTNEVGSGGYDATQTASTTTMTNTDYIIGSQATIAGGVLDGHIDSHRIMWIGHSTGAEGVVRAHTRLRTGDFVPEHYAIDDIVLVSAIAPVSFWDGENCTPYDVDFHMFIGGADTDTSGAPVPSYTIPMSIYERGFGNKQLIYVHGAGHADFHDGGGSSWAEGPDLIGRAATHAVVKGYYLPLVELYLKNNIAAKDFFTRMYEGFHPMGIPPNVIIANEYKDAQAAGNFVVDDYQTESATGLSSSGGAVTFDVPHLDEVLMCDLDGSFEWTGDQPSNGMTRYRFEGDDPHCAVMDWTPSSPAWYELELTPGQRDVSDRAFLSFRACQGTRHPETVALDGPLSFTVTLGDGTGTTSSIDFANYGHITRPYQRTGFGVGAGWGNEFSSVRLRLTDFLANGSGLDLADVAAVRFEFGAAFGSSRGRIGLDDIELTHDGLPTISVTISLPDGAPAFLPPGEPTDIDVEIVEGYDTLVAGSAQLHYRYDGGAWHSVELVQIAGELWRGTLPPPSCGDAPEFYFSVEGEVTGPVFAPPSGAAQPFVASVGTFISILEDDFETDQGWTVEDDPSLTDGSWERGVPADDGTDGDPLSDYDGSGQCYLTANRLGNSDVDWGPTMLISPTLDLSERTSPVVRFAYWWANDDQDGDPFDVHVSADAGETWVWVMTVADTQPAWFQQVIYVADHVTLTPAFQVRFSGSDNPNNSKTEGGIDAVEVFDVECE